MIANAAGKPVLINTGVKVGSKYDGTHQGASHVRTGSYWEAMYVADRDERMIQDALMEPHKWDTQTRSMQLLKTPRHPLAYAPQFTPVELKNR